MNTTTVLLIVHGLLAVALLGAITHQAVSVWAPARKPAGSFVGRFRSVPGPSYANAIVVLYVLTFVLGGDHLRGLPHRGEDRGRAAGAVVAERRVRAEGALRGGRPGDAAGVLALLAPARCAEDARTRAVLTALLAFIVWWNFLVGHVLNNIRGFGVVTPPLVSTLRHRVRGRVRGRLRDRRREQLRARSPITRPVGEWGLGVEKPRDGPAMYWYGWLATSGNRCGGSPALHRRAACPKALRAGSGRAGRGSCRWA